jgi:hypothetical protein
MGEWSKAKRVSVEKPEGERFFKDLVVNGREILN